jgi:putative redox protein
MVDVDVSVRWTGEGLSFDASSRGQSVRLDGAGREGPTPVQALLLSLGACTAADVVELLGKMRVPFEALELLAEGDRAADAPRRYVSIRMKYITRGLARVDEDKLRRAVQLSHAKYCSVLHSLRADLEVTTDIELA